MNYQKSRRNYRRERQRVDCGEGWCAQDCTPAKILPFIEKVLGKYTVWSALGTHHLAASLWAGASGLGWRWFQSRYVWENLAPGRECADE